MKQIPTPSSQTLADIEEALLLEEKAEGERLYNEELRAERAAREAAWDSDFASRMDADVADRKAADTAWWAGESARVAEFGKD